MELARGIIRPRACRSVFLLESGKAQGLVRFSGPVSSTAPTTVRSLALKRASRGRVVRGTS